MEMQYGTHIRLLLCSDILLIIGSAKECQKHTVCTKRRLDNIRDITLALAIIKVGQILTGCILMLGQIIIGTICDTPKFAPSKWE